MQARLEAKYDDKTRKRESVFTRVLGYDSHAQISSESSNFLVGMVSKGLEKRNKL